MKTLQRFLTECSGLEETGRTPVHMQRQYVGTLEEVTGALEAPKERKKERKFCGGYEGGEMG